MLIILSVDAPLAGRTAQEKYTESHCCAYSKAVLCRMSILCRWLTKLQCPSLVKNFGWNNTKSELRPTCADSVSSPQVGADDAWGSTGLRLCATAFPS